MTRRKRRVPRWLRVKLAREASRRALTRAERERTRRQRALLFWLVVVLFSVALIGLTCQARESRAAARVPVTWTAPAGARVYEAIARRPDGVWMAVTLSADSATVKPVSPGTAGARELGWVLISTDWRAGGWMLRVRGCNSLGCGAWSNATVHLAGLPDTVWHLERLGAAGVRLPREGRVFLRAAGRVGWSLERADSVTPATIEHQQLAQERERARLCALYGYWLLRGEVQPCP